MWANTYEEGGEQRGVVGGLKSFLLLVGDMREGVAGGKYIHRAIIPCQGCQAQPRDPSPICWPQVGAPALLGTPPGTLRASPNCNHPSTASCTSGEPVHHPSSALTPSEPSSPAPQSHTAIPKMHGGQWGGHTSTLTTPALLATLSYTASTCTAATWVQGRRPRLCPLLQAPAQ